MWREKKERDVSIMAQKVLFGLHLLRYMDTRIPGGQYHQHQLRVRVGDDWPIGLRPSKTDSGTIGWAKVIRCSCGDVADIAFKVWQCMRIHMYLYPLQLQSLGFRNRPHQSIPQVVLWRRSLLPPQGPNRFSHRMHSSV